MHAELKHVPLVMEARGGGERSCVPSYAELHSPKLIEISGLKCTGRSIGSSLIYCVCRRLPSETLLSRRLCLRIEKDTHPYLTYS